MEVDKASRKLGRASKHPSRETMLLSLTMSPAKRTLNAVNLSLPSKYSSGCFACTSCQPRNVHSGHCRQLHLRRAVSACSSRQTRSYSTPCNEVNIWRPSTALIKQQSPSLSLSPAGSRAARAGPGAGSQQRPPDGLYTLPVKSSSSTPYKTAYRSPTG